MVTAQFLLGASLWALLVVDICCGPTERFNPRPGSSQGASSRLSSPGNVPAGAYTEEEAAPPPELALSASSSSRPVQSRGSAGRREPAGPAQAGVKSAPKDKWLISPPIFGDEETPEVESSRESFVRRAPPPEYETAEADEEGPELAASSNSLLKLAPPRPEYQAGELSHYEKTAEGGNYESEIEEQGFLPPPPEPKYPLPVPLPLDASTSTGFVSQPRPPPPPVGRWFFYPYYDYRFLAGNYPVGTYSHFSSSFEQGHDNNDEAHYIRESLAASQPVNAPLEQEAPEVEPPEVEPRQIPEALMASAKSGPKRGAAAARSFSPRATRPHYRGYGYGRV